MRLVFALLLLTIGACAVTPEAVRRPPFEPRSVRDEGDRAALKLAAERHLQAIDRTLARQDIAEERRKAILASRKVTRAILSAVDDPAWDGALPDDLTGIAVGDPPAETLVTGYYTPIIRARRTADNEFRHAVHGLPPDLVTANLAEFGKDGIIRGRVEGNRFIPYYTRKEILEGRLSSVPVLYYTNDPLALFILHVQGSGIAEFEDGTRMRLNYASGNGRPYVSIGRLLIDEGKVSREAMSMQAIIRYFSEHPDERDDYLNRNPSYVFFGEAPDGPFGSSGAVVTAGRSIAADNALIPDLAVLWLETEIPTEENPDGSVKPRSFRSIVFSQDTGGAIRGNHIDLYLGEGAQAGFQAGQMKGQGSLHILLPKD